MFFYEKENNKNVFHCFSISTLACFSPIVIGKIEIEVFNLKCQKNVDRVFEPDLTSRLM
jgi:hypothetical protein